MTGKTACRLRCKSQVRLLACLQAGLLFVLLAGCATGISPITAPGDNQAIELRATPFFPQTEYHCGPAALATALGAGGHPITPDTLAPQLFIPGLQGSLQAEILAAARGQGRIPVRLGADPAVLIDTLELGKPVIVLQNLGLPSKPHWHYAVLVGYDYEKQRVILRSGTERRKTYKLRTFKRTWDWGGNWAVVLLNPWEFIETVRRQDYFSSLAAIEQTQHRKLAFDAYQFARSKWPRSPVVLAGLGNSAFALGDLETAEQVFREFTHLDKDSLIAHNNLAHVLLIKGCAQSALAQIQPLIDRLDAADPMATAVKTTYTEIKAAIAEGTSTECPRNVVKAKKSGPAGPLN